MSLDEKVNQLLSEAPAIPRLGIGRYQYWCGKKRLFGRRFLVKTDRLPRQALDTHNHKKVS
jgi:hypothetical protein